MKVLFFASLKERLKCAELELDASNINSVSELRDTLVSKGALWADALSSPNLLVAVNQEMSNPNTPISDADEVAFFPPVTGG